MLELNSYVMYGDNGVCLVADKKKERFAGETKEYFILRPVNNSSSTFYVPTDNDKLLSKMRKILSKDEILEIVHSLPDESTQWVDDNKDREALYEEIFDRGDRKELLLLIKNIYEHKKERKEQGKKLWTIDENAMKHAEKLVYEEFAVVLGIKPGEVLDFIGNEIDKAQQN